MEAKKEFTTLENGWKREVVYRKSGVTAGRADVYYHSPCGKRFRSRLQVRDFMGDAFNPADFDFQTPHGAGYVPPARPSRPHRTGGGGGGGGGGHGHGHGHSRPRQNDSRLARAVKSLQQQRPLGQQLLERNYCGLVRQPVTCLLPQAHDMALARQAPPMPSAGAGTQKGSLTLRDSQWLHEHRLRGLVPVDGRTGERVPDAELAFHNRPPPQLQSLVNGAVAASASTAAAATSASSTAAATPPPPAPATTHNGARTSPSTSSGAAWCASASSPSASTSGGGGSSTATSVRGRQAAPPLSASPLRGVAPAGASPRPSAAGTAGTARGQPMPSHSLTPLIGKSQSPQRPRQQQHQQQQQAHAPGGHLAGGAWRNGSTQHQQQQQQQQPQQLLAVGTVGATGAGAQAAALRAAAAAMSSARPVDGGSVWPGMRLATSSRQNVQVATAMQSRAPQGVPLPGGQSGVDANASMQSISDMDIHIQEERVRQLKEKLLMAAGK